MYVRNTAIYGPPIKLIFNCGTIFVSVGDFGAKRPREKSINIIISRFGFHVSVCPCIIILNPCTYTDIKCRTQNIINCTYNIQRPDKVPIQFLKKTNFLLNINIFFLNYKILTNFFLQKSRVKLYLCSNLTI